MPANPLLTNGAGLRAYPHIALPTLNTMKNSAAENPLSRDTRQADDLDGAFSGYGHYCPEGIPVEQAIFALLAAFAVAFGILFRAVTLITGKRRRKRALDGSLVDTSLDPQGLRFEGEESISFIEDVQMKAADFFWWGRCHTFGWLGVVVRFVGK